MIRKADINDLAILTRLASSLWSDCPESDLQDGFSSVLADNGCACFLKYADDRAVGFAQCGLRHDYVEGTTTSPVGYLEGIFVEKDCREKGFAKELLFACENWARAQGCSEFASDCELNNDDSIAFHEKAGFEEVGRIVCFKKNI